MEKDGKLTSMSEAAESIKSGSTLTFSGFGHSGHPMAFVRELIRRRRTDLRLTAIAECWPAELLVAAGAVSTIQMSNLMFEGLGRCRAISNGAEQGRIRIEDHSHLGLSLRMLAAGWGMDFVQVRSMAGSDLVNKSTFDPQKFVEIPNPFGEGPSGVVSPLAPDVAVIHVSATDVLGNAIVDGATSVIEAQIRAARRVILTAETIAPRADIRARNRQVMVPGILVDQIVHAPFGAHPTGMFGFYDYDAPRLRAYYESSRSSEALEAYLRDDVYADGSHADYLNRIGTADLLQLRIDPVSGYSLAKSEVL